MSTTTAVQFSGDVRGLTLTQPWASAIAAGLKTYETRSWRTAWRGDLLIHASKNYPPDARAFASTPDSKGFTLESILDVIGQPAKSFAGMIVASATLMAMVPTDQLRFELEDLELSLGNYSDGRWAWKLGNVWLPERPRVALGKQGLWKPHESLLEWARATTWRPIP